MRVTSCLAICLAAASPAAAQTQAPSGTLIAVPAAPPAYSSEDIFATVTIALPDVGGIAFSRDGHSILLSSDQSGILNSYIAPANGGPAMAMTRSATDGLVAVSYFPQDDRLLLAGDRGGDERTHIFAREVGGTVRDLTPGDEVKADFLGWNADGGEFYILSNARDPGQADLYAVDGRTYAARMILMADEREILDVSPDGRHAVLIARTGSADSNLFLAEIGSGVAPRLITPHSGRALYGSFGFTPDGSSLIIATDAHGEFAEAWCYDLKAESMQPYLKGEWDLAWLRLSRSGRYRAAAFNENGRTALALVDLHRGKPITLSGIPDGEITNLQFDRAEDRIVFTLASDTSPADVYIADLATGAARRLTNALGERIDERRLVRADNVTIPGPDGHAIPALVYRPHGATAAHPVPAVVWVHGGPDQSRHGWAPTLQHLVGQGFAVIAPNFRGSTGFGKSFLQADDRAHGDADLADVVTAGDWMRAQDWVADDKVAVMGRSYGGFLTLAALAFRPDAFEAGIDIFGISNWQRTLTSIPPWWESLRVALYEEMGDPATDGERHRRISPLFHADRIRRPLLVVQGANDPRVLQAESDEIVAAVRRNGTPVEYLLFPDEGHGFRKRENLVRAQDAYIAFLRSHLGDPRFTETPGAGFQ
ncbi:dipeptidyl aminopeptidase/acylaminoacyl peptidase [Sphingopyxis sp. OAS728]|uniref:S9 family peptidase n=1 Tax=Sphingopyxis sp. OAS728 TaxID=2663823 RepID=UPI00178BA77D|nr:S9 family peptidase [Sphingopyxis sp. OAS728]MBE1527964.1 dipeptidyl aminopeptidase/acylaminoacyl peptidase [Sphingopyxis sp. OAS728]